MKILLHACCGPCSLEPVRALHEAGHELVIAYMNSNIYPPSEYEKRSDALLNWANDNSIDVIFGSYNPNAWDAAVGHFGIAKDTRPDRCRACYALRLNEVARMASELGFDAISSTLSVSPYQYTQTIKEELERAAKTWGLVAIFEDFRPLYPEATRRSKDLGMYRQNYCGCRFSMAEAARERKERKEARAQAKAQKREQYEREHAAEILAQAEEALKKKQERAAYNQKQAAKKAALKRFRNNKGIKQA